MHDFLEGVRSGAAEARRDSTWRAFLAPAIAVFRWIFTVTDQEIKRETRA